MMLKIAAVLVVFSCNYIGSLSVWIIIQSTWVESYVMTYIYGPKSNFHALSKLEICAHFHITKSSSFQVKLSEYIGKKYVILFFYPLDFTFVCPTGSFDTEIILIERLCISGC